MKTLIVGIGNPILTDDGVGLRVASEIQRGCPSDVEVMQASLSGISLLDHIIGYDRLIIIDSVKTEKGVPGTFYKLKLEDLGHPHQSVSYSHGVNLQTAIKFGKRLGYDIPQIIDIFAIEIENNTTFGEELTQRVKACIPKIVSEIQKEL